MAKVLMEFMWFVLFSISVITAIATIIIIWHKFQTSPTLTYLHIEREKSSVDFPNVYLCFDSTHLNFSKLHLTSKQIEKLESLYSWKGESLALNNDDVDVVDDYKAHFLKITPDCQDFFSHCAFGKNAYKCADLFVHKITTPDGVCCEFNSRSIEKDDLPWALQFKPRDYPISVHMSGKFDGPPVYKQQAIYKITRASSIQLSLSITSTASSLRFLTLSQRKCAFPNESPSHVHCQRIAIEKIFKSTCSCIPWFYATNFFEECPLFKYQCLSNIDNRQIIGRNCYISCEHTAYNCEKIERFSNTGEEVVEIKFLSWPDVRYRRVTRFGWLDLVVSFGGVAGFFLGFSIIISFESFYYFTLRTYCGAVLSIPKIRYNIQVKPKNAMNKKNINFKYSDNLNKYYFK